LVLAVAAALPAPPATAAPLWIEACQRLLRIYTGEPKLAEERAKAALPGIRDANLERWRKNVATAPEALNGLKLDEALALLSKLKQRKDPTQHGRRVRNATFFVPLGDGRVAVVKKVFTRSELGESRVYHTTNNVKYEVIAFIIDRYLGINAVAPAIMLDGQTVAQLFVRAAPVSYLEAGHDPAMLLEISHVRLLDLLVGNADRAISKDLLAGENGKVVAPDFDLSRPSSFCPVDAALYFLRASELVVEPGRKLGSRGPTPGMFLHSVLEKLRALDREKLLELARGADIQLTEPQIVGVLSSRAAALRAIEHWKQVYGADLIEIP
jgi:hypothetical protein